MTPPAVTLELATVDPQSKALPTEQLRYALYGLGRVIPNDLSIISTSDRTIFLEDQYTCMRKKKTIHMKKFYQLHTQLNVSCCNLYGPFRSIENILCLSAHNSVPFNTLNVSRNNVASMWKRRCFIIVCYWVTILL